MDNKEQVKDFFLSLTEKEITTILKRNIKSNKKALELTLNTNENYKLKSYNAFILALGEDMDILNEEGVIKTIVNNSLLNELQNKI